MLPPPASSASAPSAHHVRLWWRRRGRAGAVGATFAAGLLLTLSYYASLPPATSSSSSPGPGPALVGLTLVRRAEEKGARFNGGFRWEFCSVLGWERPRVTSAERVWEWISELANPLGGTEMCVEVRTDCH